MFRTPNIKVGLKAISLRVEEVGEEERRVADAKFVLLPFTEDLARQVGDRIPGYLWNPATHEPWPEIQDALLAVHVPLQRVEVREAPDQTKASAVIEPAGIRKFRVQRDPKHADRFFATFTVSFEIDGASADALLTLIRLHGQVCHLTTVSLQRALSFVDGGERIDPATGEILPEDRVGLALATGRATAQRFVSNVQRLCAKDGGACTIRTLGQPDVTIDQHGVRREASPS